VHTNLYNSATLNQNLHLHVFIALSLNALYIAIEIKAEGNETPKKGYKSITVKTEVYDYYYNKWLTVKDDYTLKKGIQSFSSYITYILFQLIEEENKKEK
jgi:hypothetical protein